MQTSLYDDCLVNDALSSRGSWQNPTEAGYDIVDCDEPDAFYFNRTHAACSVQNLYDCQPDRNITAVQFNTLLQELKEDNIRAMLGQVFDTPVLVEGGLLHEKSKDSAYQVVSNSNRFVGQRFRLSKQEHALMLNTVGLHFNGVATITLYLVNELYGVVDKWRITTKANQQIQWPLNTVIRYYSEFALGGEWFLCYDQSELGEVKAVDFTPYRIKYKTFNAESFEANKLSDTVADFDKQTYSTGSNSYGLNLQVSAFHDYTNKITQNAHMFDTLQGLMMAAKVIELVRTSHRLNSTKRLSDEYIAQLYWDLNGLKTADGLYVPGINSKIGKELKSVRELLQPKAKTSIKSYGGCN